jgi:flavin-dependent dehydrogenase
MKNLYECVVIGGGVAGSSAAYHLAKRGYNVALLEKTQVPHHKVCGEFLSFEAIDLIEEMGIILDQHVPRIKHFQLLSSQSKAGYTFPSPGRGISRYKLDEDLLGNAKEAGVDIFRGVSMRSYHRADQGLFKVVTHTDDFYARNLFLATGKHDHSKEHKRKGKDDSFIGFKTHMYSEPLNQIFKETTVLFTFPGGYGGICPVENLRMNFCFVIDRKIYKSLNSDFAHCVAFLRRSNLQLDLILEKSDFSEPVCAVGFIPYGYVRPPSMDENIYFLGDQRAVIPSFTGDGMAIALNTAKSCVHAFDHRQRKTRGAPEPIQKILKRQMRWALVAHRLLKSSWVVEFCMLLPGIPKLLIQTFFQKTRMPIKREDHGSKFKNVQDHYSRC